MTPASAKVARHELARALRDTLGAKVAVFPSPPETVTAPGVVIVPRTPYRRPSTFCQYEVALRVVVFIQRASGADALDALDRLMDDVVACVQGIDWVTWDTVTDIGTTQEVGSLEYLTASIDLTAFV